MTYDKSKTGEMQIDDFVDGLVTVYADQDDVTLPLVVAGPAVFDCLGRSSCS